MELDLKSLTDLFDNSIAELGLIDNCELGVEFLNIGKRMINWCGDNARQNNVNTKKLREAISYSRRSLEFLQQYTQIGVTAEVLSELEEKVRLTSDYAKKFGCVKKFGCGGWHGSKVDIRRTHHIRKEKNLVEQIIENERRIQKILRQRVWSTDDEEAQAYKSLVIGAWIYLASGHTPKNRNDEKIVAAALSLAVKQDKYVAIVTADARIECILKKTQQALQTRDIPHMLRATNQPASTVSFDRLKQRLEDGKVMVITALPTKARYEVEYCAEEFYQRKTTQAPVQIQV